MLPAPLEAFLLIAALCGLFLLVAAVCDDALGPALESASHHLRISHEVAAATILAFGLALPEIALNALAAMSGSDAEVSAAMGAVLGSAHLGFTVIPCACILFAKDRMFELEPPLLMRDVAFFLCVLAFLLLFARNGSISMKESAVLVLLYFPYLMVLLSPSRAMGENASSTPSNPVVDAEDRVVDYGTVVLNDPHSRSLASHSDDPERARVRSESSIDSEGEWVPHSIKRFLPPFGLDPRERFFSVLLISIVFILVCADACLRIAVALSEVMHMSDSWTGFVLMGLGAQLEDIFAAVYLARVGRSTSAMAAIVGSQVLNICAGVGLPFLIKSLVTGQAVLVHESITSALVVFACVLWFSVLCFKDLTSPKATLRVIDAPLLLLAYFAGVYFVFESKV